MSVIRDFGQIILVIVVLLLVSAFLRSQGGLGSLNLSSGLRVNRDNNNNEVISQGNENNGGDESTIPEEIEGVITDLRDLDKEFDRIEGNANSKYKGKVTISSHTGARQSSPDKERIDIKVSSRVDEKIGISGWRLESAVSGAGDNIEKGSYLPYSGRVNSEIGIFVEAGDKIIITTGRSPIGVSFRLNKCTGYFEQFQDFNPSIKKSCPKPIDDIPNLGVGETAEECINFVERLPRCEVYLKELPLGLGGSCTEYVTSKINYNTCVEKHKDDSNFYSKEWRVYLNRNDELWRSKREIIKLIDNEGKVVDAITY